METSHKVFYLARLKVLVKYWMGGSNHVMNSSPRVSGDLKTHDHWIHVKISEGPWVYLCGGIRKY